MACTCAWCYIKFALIRICFSGNLTSLVYYVIYIFLLNKTYVPHQGNASSLIIQLATLKDVPTTFENQIQTSVEDLNLFEILQPVLSHINMLWELVLTAEPLIVMATSPTYCSAMVLALTR